VIESGIDRREIEVQEIGDEPRVGDAGDRRDRQGDDRGRDPKASAQRRYMLTTARLVPRSLSSLRSGAGVAQHRGEQDDHECDALDQRDGA